MKAIRYTKYGSPEALELQEVAKPAPQEHQVLVKVKTASANAMEWRRFTMGPLMARMVGGGLLRPKNTSLGADLAGTVEAVGAAVTQFQPGDEVFGTAAGSFAEYAIASEKYLAKKPASVAFEAAATLPVAGCTALQGLRDEARVEAGQKVLIYGAGGGVGMFCVQIAKCFGAHVTAVCGAGSMDAMHAIGADRAIDYARESFTDRRERYDVIVAANGYRPILEYWRALTPAGTCLVLGGSLAQIFQTMLLRRWLSKPNGRKIKFRLAHIDQGDLVFLGELLEAGKLTPVIDRRYPLSGVGEAMRYLAQGHPRGKVIINMQPGNL